VSTVGGFGIKSTRSVSAYLTRRRGSEAGWSITSGKLGSSSEASAGECGETATNARLFRDAVLGQDRGRASRSCPQTAIQRWRQLTSRNHTNLGRSRPNHRKDAKLHKGLVPRRNGPIRHNSG